MATYLKDLIETISEDIPTNIFTIEDEDPHVILGKINEVIKNLKNLQSTINSSDAKSQEALQNSINALNSAKNSLESSNLALDSSNTALATANASLDSSNTALATANASLEKSNEALNNSQEALNKVNEGVGTKVYDTHNTILETAKFTGHNGINVDMSEDDTNTFDIRLDQDITTALEETHTTTETLKSRVSANEQDIINITDMLAGVEEKVDSELPNRITNLETTLTEITPKVAKALVSPMTTPTTTELVAVNNKNSQTMIEIGTGLVIENNTLKSTGGTEIIDNLNSTSISAGLSANQGRVLDNKINNINSSVNTNTNNISALQTNLDTTNSSVNTNTNNISALQTNLDTTNSNVTNNTNAINTKADRGELNSANSRISQLENDRVKTSFSNVTYPTPSVGATTQGVSDRVIEMYVSSDGKTWYRKWKSGWKECGQFIASPSSGKATITLPLEFTTVVDAQITVRRSDNTDYETIRQVYITNITTTTISINNLWVTPTGSGSSSNPYYYVVKGF